MSASLPIANPRRPLPCYPCPYLSVCCRWGVSLLPEEAETIRREVSPAAVVFVDGEHRTAVVDGACCFSKNNGCTIHAEPYYPALCRGFPFADGYGQPYDGDVMICPDFLPGANRMAAAPPTDL